MHSTPDPSSARDILTTDFDWVFARVAAAVAAEGAAPHEAEEAAQEAIVEAYHRAGDIRHVERIVSYAVTIAIRHFRQARVRANGLLTREVWDDIAPSRPDDDVVSMDECSRIWSSIGKLPPRDVVLITERMKGTSIDDLADMVGLGRDSVAPSLNRARSRLREKLVRRG